MHEKTLLVKQSGFKDNEKPGWTSRRMLKRIKMGVRGLYDLNQPNNRRFMKREERHPNQNDLPHEEKGLHRSKKYTFCFGH